MKRFFLLMVIFLVIGAVNAQPWNALLPQDKLNRGELTFYDYQNAFNAYWQPYQVEKGFYVDASGNHVKAGGWKQFKRWEQYWATRVDKQTGAFPSVSLFDIYQEEMASARSLSGNWTAMGPSYSSGGYAGLGRINCIAFHPINNSVIYIGAASGGIWKTSNGGSNWIPLGDDNAALGVSEIIPIVNGSSETIYLATGDKDHSDTYSVGVLKSIDGGNTWQTTGLDWTPNQQRLIHRMIMNPNNQNILYAATSNGLYKTIDAGDTWTQMISTTYVDLEFDPSNSSYLYASDKNGKVYKSVNSGSTWSIVNNVTGGRRTELAVTPDNPAVVYALVANTSNGLKGIYKSVDFGNTFTLSYDADNLLGWDCNAGDSGGQAWYDLCIAADPNNENVVFIGGVNTWKSSDGGATWSISTHWSSTCGGSATTVHADKHTLVYRHNTSELFEGNDGGIYSTYDGGNTWDHLSNTLEISQIYRISCAQTNNTDIITGLQDNGSKLLASNGWTDVYGGDGMECIIDPTDDNVQYASLYYGQVFRTLNKWNSSYGITGSISGNAAWVAPYSLDPNDNYTIFIGYQDVWKSFNQGASWIQLSFWGGNTLQSLAVAPSNSDYIYAATYNTLYYSPDGGSNWSNITGSLPVSSASITYIAVKADDPSTIWVSMGGFNTHGIYESTNSGATWTNISTGLPEIPVNSVIQNKQNASEVELYAATDVGVYMKVGSDNWIAFFDGLPNVVVNELDIYYDDANPANSRLRAGTFGRGLWESDLYTSTPAAPVAEFEGNPTAVMVNDPVAFTDLSIGTIDTWSWDFGDGNVSSDQNPTHNYTAVGTYTVALTVSGTQGSDTETKTDYITVTNLPPPVAEFEATPLNGLVPLEVTFTDLSTGDIDSWSWDFGDGEQSSDQHPVHTYTTHGLYTVALTVTGPAGNVTETKTDYIEVMALPPVAEFEGNPVTGNTPLEVSFTDLSTGEIDTWTWDFGDGNSSPETNPVHTYTAAGYYTVALTVAGPGGTVVNTKTDYIEVFAVNPPDADFTADPTTGQAPLSVSFTNLTTGETTGYQWDFGDGEVSTEENPMHVYQSAGSFTVALKASGPGGSDTETKADFILIPVGMDEASAQAYVVYPNPTSDILTILFPDGRNRILRILDRSGKEVARLSSSSAKESVDLTGFASGNYWLVIEENRITKATVKVIKQ